MVRTGRLLAISVAILAGMVAPAGARAAEWVRTESGTKAFALFAPRDQQVVKQGSEVNVRVLLLPGVRLKAVIAHGYNTGRLTGRLRRAERPMGGGRMQITTVLGGLKRGPNLLTFVTTLKGQTAGTQVVINRVLRSRVIAEFRILNVGGGQAPVARLLPDQLGVTVHATLNGRDISSLFAPGTPLLRLVALTPRLGLRHGTNHLRVFVRSFKGFYEARRLTFHISLRQVLADAGPHLRVRLGLDAVLDGSRSLRPGGVRGGALHYLWKIVSKPRGAKARLFHADSARAVLRTDVSRPGTYTARLSVSYIGRGKRVAASLNVASTTVEADPQPRVPVDTFASENGQTGIAVGVQSGCTDPTESSSQPCFYANPGTAVELQVLVLDRNTLAPPSNYSDYNEAYSTSDLAGFATQMQALASTQQGETCPSYNTDVIVILALRSGSITDTANFDKGMSVFNVNPDAPDATSSSQCTENTTLSAGPFSVIAIPGTLDGKAWTNDQLTLDNPQGLVEQPGEILGFLKEGADDPSASPLLLSYGFTFPDSVFFDTRASGSSGDEVELGPTSPDQPYGNTPVQLATPASGQGAIDVLSFDTVDPQNTLHLEVTVGNTGSDSGLDWSELSSVLSDLIQDKPPSGPCTHCGVILVSEGQLGGYGSEPDASSFLPVLDDLDQLGVDPDTFARAVSSQGTYSMLSADGIGYAASSVLAQGVSDPDQSLLVYSGTLTGNLARGNAGQLYPLTGDPTGVTTASVLLPMLYGNQGQWAMTPTPSDVVDCPGGPLPPQTGCVASCPAVAFAYLVEQAFPDLFDGELPTLWGSGSTGDAVSGCGGQSGGPDVDPAAVLSAETALRDTYPDYSISLSQASVLAVQMPSGAPFSSTDFTSAQQQMITELAQRQQVITTMSTAADVQTNSQTNVSIDLAQVASDVETGALSSITSEIEAQSESDASWFVELAMHWSNGINKVLNFYRTINPFLNSAYLWTGLLGDGSLAIFDTAEGPPGNPAALVQDYVLLEAQLQQQEIDVEDQVANTLTAQSNGVQQTEEILLTSPTMMSAFDQAALTTWNFGANTANVYTAAQNAYLYRVVQLAYEDMWPQAYSAARFNYTNACQSVAIENTSQLACWSTSKDEWAPTDGASSIGGTPVSLTGASDSALECFSTGDGGTVVVPSRPLSGADLGSGFGEGTEYQAPFTVATSGENPAYLDYVMVASSALNASTLSHHFPAVASYGTVEPFFAQPSDSISDPTSSSPPGFYAPDFWQQNLPVDEDIQCATPDSLFEAMTEQSVSGYYGNVESTDSWPTPTNK